MKQSLLFQKAKLVLLDKLVPGVDGRYAAVYENFERDLYYALEQSLERLSKNHTIKIVFPVYTYHPGEILCGFYRFCDQAEPIKEGEVFIVLMEDDLVVLIGKILATKIKAGEDIGVIFYNETPLKKTILDGITTISTDFRLMGEKTAQMILDNSREHFEVPFRIELRPPL